MALDSTAKLQNIKSSINKYLFDNLFTIEEIDITYDSSIEHHPQEDKKWIDFTILGNDLGQFQYQDVRFVCATRGDVDGNTLLDTRDILISYLTDPASTNGFRSRRITLYNVDDKSAIVDVGSMQFIRLRQSPILMAEDKTKYIIIDATLYFESKL